MADRSRRFIRTSLAGLLVLALSSAYPAPSLQAADGQYPPVSIRASQILDLSRYLTSTQGAPDAYGRILKAAFGDAPGNTVKVTAYEENESFIYAVATIQSQDPKTPGVATHFVRRFIALNPSLFLIEDEFPNPSSSSFNFEGLNSTEAPQVSGRTAEIYSASGKISAELLFPTKASYRVARNPAGQESNGYVLEPASDESKGNTRLLQVLRMGEGAPSNPSGQHTIVTTTDDWKFTATIGGKVFTLMLPPPAMGAGTVSVSNADGKRLVATRPFPSGILPHGPEGNRLLDIWDSEYRRPEPALWDIGRPSDELQHVIEEGKIARCRVVDMCCGSGTDAIYLASKGFDVTAIDVAPTALGLAMEKARKANVSVNWKVADILAPPDLKPFEFIYDRGCYHVVRDQNLNAYIETVRRFSHPGTQFLLLATRRAEQDGVEGSGVTEEELRFDFMSLFDVEWLREIVLESNLSSGGPPAWSAMMKRNSAP